MIRSIDKFIIQNNFDNISDDEFNRIMKIEINEIDDISEHDLILYLNESSLSKKDDVDDKEIKRILNTKIDDIDEDLNDPEFEKEFKQIEKDLKKYKKSK